MKTDKCLVDLGQVIGEAYEEAEPMAVIVVGEAPQNCEECPKYLRPLCDEAIRFIGGGVNREELCPIRKAIAYVEPNGHVKYLGEKKG